MSLSHLRLGPLPPPPPYPMCWILAAPPPCCQWSMIWMVTWQQAWVRCAHFNLGKSGKSSIFNLNQYLIDYDIPSTEVWQHKRRMLRSKFYSGIAHSTGQHSLNSSARIGLFLQLIQLRKIAPKVGLRWERGHHVKCDNAWQSHLWRVHATFLCVTRGDVDIFHYEHALHRLQHPWKQF